MSVSGNVEFDEEWYLERYPDIKNALNNGIIHSALEHYLSYGKVEGREARFKEPVRRQASAACLILAHRAPQVLCRAAILYLNAGWDLFIHLDKKDDFSAYERQLGEIRPHCNFIDDRVEVFWGGFTMIKAQINLINAAMSTGGYERYILLTDDTFPVKSPRMLSKVFHPQYDYITTQLQTSGTFFDRYNRFFLNDYAPTQMRGRNQDNTFIEDDFLEAIYRLAILKRKGKQKIPLYFGSQFWSLTTSTITKILEIIRSDDYLVQSFEFSALPDELMFQTIVGNYISSPRENGPVYADFSVSPGPRIFRNISDLQAIPEYTNFIRKIDPNAGNLIEHLFERSMEDQVS